jgi:hypothetical protein
MVGLFKVKRLRARFMRNRVLAQAEDQVHEDNVNSALVLRTGWPGVADAGLAVSRRRKRGPVRSSTIDTFRPNRDEEPFFYESHL